MGAFTFTPTFLIKIKASIKVTAEIELQHKTMLSINVFNQISR